MTSKVTVTLDAEVLEEREGSVTLRLKTGYGDPQVMMVGELVKIEPKEAAACRS